MAKIVIYSILKCNRYLLCSSQAVNKCESLQYERYNKTTHLLNKTQVYILKESYLYIYYIWFYYYQDWMLLNEDTLKASLRRRLRKVDRDRVSAYSWISHQKKYFRLLLVSWDPWWIEPWFQPHLQICGNALSVFLANHDCVLALSVKI